VFLSHHGDYIRYVALQYDGAECSLTLEIAVPSIVSFVSTVVLLFIYSLLDLQDRHIPNSIMLLGGVIGVSIVILTGHLFSQITLHLSAIAFMVCVGYILFRLGAFGGADVKTVTSVAILSPGIEFSTWSDPVLEGIVASGILLVITLFCAYLFSRFVRKAKEFRATPLLPIMLVAYLVLQIFALF
jgi:Flp pilus assembly protein protease CpaA